MEALGSQVLPTAAQQLDGADPASCGKTKSRYYLSAGRAAHLEAVRQPHSRQGAVATMTVYSFRKALDEGPSSPLVGRLFMGILELRDIAAMGEFEEARKEAFIQAFDTRFNPIFEACLATRDAAQEVVKLIAMHKGAIASGRIVRIGEGHYQVLETIDRQLGQAVDKLLDQAVVACKTTLQRMLAEVFGIEIGFAYQKDAAFQEALSNVDQEGHSDLAPYLTAVRQAWLSSLLAIRNRHEHEGWALRKCDYALASPQEVVLLLPVLERTPIDVWATKTANQALTFVEEMLVYAMSRRTRHPIFITEIPEGRRDPAQVKRFRPAARGLEEAPKWIPSYAEGHDFV